MSAPTYYRPSNRISPRFWIVLPLIGGIGAAALAVIYAYACCLITQVFENSGLYIFATPLFAAGLAAVAQQVSNRGEVRRPQLRLPIALAIGLFGLYASWHAYLVLVDLRVFDPMPHWTMSPVAVARAMSQLAASEGQSAWFGWLLEAAVVVGMIAYLTRSIDIEIPFCEQCSAWASEVSRFELASREIPAATTQLREGNAAALATMQGREPGETSYGVVHVYRCSCGASRHVSLDRATYKRGRSSGMRYAPKAIGGRPKYWYDTGSGDTTELTPVVVNLAIDEATEKALESPRSSKTA